MVLKKKHIQDITKIMRVEEEMIRLLPKLQSKTNTMNPWVKQLPGIFRGLKFEKGLSILDIPCGEGGVSVPLAENYGVKVLGFDILPDYIQNANKFARKLGVQKLCRFRVGDIRNVVKSGNVCDVLLWIGAPHLWGKSKPTIKALRNCVKNGGLIFIGDAYLYPKSESGSFDDLETLDDTTKGYTSYGDELIRLIDYRGKLWKEDYRRTRKSAQEALKKTDNKKDQKIIRKYLKSLDTDEKTETECLGLAIWILEVNKT